jgi:uncharacterized membrane protein YdbT with pleckstrin-like domain
MSYIEKTLMPHETIRAQANLHWKLYVPGSLVLVLGIAMVPVSRAAAGIVLLIASVVLLRAYIKVATTELAVTNRRVVAKFGFLRRTTVELLHAKVESLRVEQTIPGRIFNFGSILIHGTGGATTPIPDIANPLAFRTRALTIIDESSRQPRPATLAAPEPVK